MIVKRYAEAFMEFASENIGSDKALEDLANAKTVFYQNPRLLDFLESPLVTDKEKLETVNRVFTDGFSEEIKYFIMFLLRKGRIDILENIANYSRVKYAHGQEVEAVLKAAYPLATSIIASIKSEIENKLKCKLHLFMDLDPSILGGVKLIIGNKIIDGSARRHLEDLRDKLLAIQVV